MKIHCSQDTRFHREDSRVISADREHPTLQLQDLIGDLVEFNHAVTRHLSPLVFGHIATDIRSLRFELSQYEKEILIEKTEPYTLINGKPVTEVMAERQIEKPVFDYRSILDINSDKITDEGVDQLPGVNKENGEELFESRFSSYEALLDAIADPDKDRHQRCQLVVHYLLSMMRDNGLLPSNNRITRLHKAIAAFPQGYAWMLFSRTQRDKDEDLTHYYFDLLLGCESIWKEVLSKRGTEDLVLVGPQRDLPLALLNGNLTIEAFRYLAVELISYTLAATLLGLKLNPLHYLQGDKDHLYLVQKTFAEQTYKDAGVLVVPEEIEEFSGLWVEELGANPLDEHLSHLTYLAQSQWTKECD